MIVLALVAMMLAQPVSIARAAGDLSVSACSLMSADVEAADAGVVDRARRLVAASDDIALTALRPSLEAAMSRHIDRRRAERCGNVIWVNSGDANDALYLEADMVGTVTKATASAARIDVTRNYVVDGTAVLAALAMDRGDRDDAVKWLEVGGRVAPNDRALLTLQSLASASGSSKDALHALRDAFIRRPAP